MKEISTKSTNIVIICYCKFIEYMDLVAFKTIRKNYKAYSDIHKLLSQSREGKFMEHELKNKMKINFKHVKKIKNRILLVVFVAIIGFVAGFVTCITRPWEKINPIITRVDGKIVKNNYMLTISTVEKIIKPASDLITSKYNYKDADTYENYKQLFSKKIPFTTDKTVFTYKGTISVGIDLSEVKYVIDNENKKIRITLPKLGIKSNEIDDSSFKYPFESDSIFNATGMSDFTELLAKLKENKEEEVKSDTKFMDTAKQNTENVLKEFLTAADSTKDYTVIFE